MNLTRNDYYGIKIGANQNVTDQQWDNFTSLGYSMTRTIQHLLKENFHDNMTYEPISQLLIELYHITGNNDTNPTYLDRIRYTVVGYEEQYNSVFIGNVIVGGVIFIVMLNIILVILKETVGKK